MSRLRNKVLMGYFPTPPSLIDALAASLRPPAGGQFRWLDPCAGEGVALSMLAERLGGETFGIELDVERAATAEQRLQHVLQGDFADMRLPVHPPGVSALFLNSPYDDDDGAGRRLELHFLRESEEWLMPGGILIFIIPQYRLSEHIARRLSSGYEQLRVYRFPDAEYARFRQVVVYGVKRAGRREDTAGLLALLQAQSAALPALPTACEAPYPIPPANGAPWFFRPFDVPPALIVAEARRTGVFAGRAWSDLVDPRPLAHSRPLMPLRRGHVGTMAAAGALDNAELSRNDTRLLIKGRLKKIQVDCTDKADKEAGVRRLVDRFEAQLVTLDLVSGAAQLVSGAGALRDWLGAWMNELAAAIVEQYQPRHRMTYHDLPGFTRLVASHSRFRALAGREGTGLFESQKHVVAACLRRLLAPADEVLAAYLWQCLAANRRPGARGAMRVLGCGYWQARRKLRRALDGCREYVIVQGEAGTGKTTIAASLAHCLKLLVGRRRPFPVLVIAPPHLVEQWPEEIRAVVPMAQAVEVRDIRELRAYAGNFQRLEPGTLSVAVISSEMLKRGSGWTPAVVRLPHRLKALDAKGQPLFAAVEEALCEYDRALSDADRARWLAEAQRRLDQSGHSVAQGDGESWPTAARRLIAEKARTDLFACPRCGSVIYEKDERGRQLIPVTDAGYFAGRKLKCSALVTQRVKHLKPNGHLEWVERELPCGEPLYQLWRGKFSREAVSDTPAYPLAEYIRRRMPGWVELTVFDECFPGETPIATPAGPIAIQDVKVGDVVYSDYNGHVEKRRVVRTLRKRHEGRLVRVSHQAGSFACTPNHKIYTGGVYVRAGHLRAGQPLTVLHNQNNHRLSVLTACVRSDAERAPQGQAAAAHPLCSTAACLGIKSIDRNDQFVYDLEIEETHCYFADGVLVSNCHTYKAQASDRGHAFGALAAASKRSVGLTATLFGGMATSIFYLLYRLDAGLRREFAWREGQRFAALYGILERVIKESDEAPDDDIAVGAFTGLRRLQTRTKELPGVSPALAVRLLDHMVFLTLSDLGYVLPPYDEIPVPIDMEAAQRRTYEQIDQTLLALAKEDFSRMSEYLQTVLLYPDACWRDLRTSAQTWKALPGDRLYPKERWLVETCKAEKAAGRKLLVYVQFTDSKDIQPRLKQLMSQAGVRAVIMPDIDPPRRMDWVRRKLKEGMDALIVNPMKVQTGLNLVAFQTIIYFEISYSLYLVHQASRRTWRLGQTEPVKVYFPIYRNAMEHRAVARVGQKLVAAQMLYGNDIAGGLVSEAGAGRGLLEELMRDVLNHTAIPDLSELFVRAERTAQESGWLMGADNLPAKLPQAFTGSSDAVGSAHICLPVRGVQSLLL